MNREGAVIPSRSSLFLRSFSCHGPGKQDRVKHFFKKVQTFKVVYCLIQVCEL